jgi:plastocyanin
VATRAKRQASVALQAAAAMAEPAPPAGDPAVTAGWGNYVTAVNRFSPAVLNIKAGQTVTWKGASLAEPHTVTFDSPFKTPEDAGVFTPGGARAGARYSGGFAHSGLIGAKPFPAETFSLVFTKPGTYPYVCVLHPGMAGQVVATAGP